MNTWWKDLPSERYWLETTDRPDIGTDLHAPQFDKNNNTNWSYTLLCELNEGDIVFHYDIGKKAIVGWSRVTGNYYSDKFEWASHAGSKGYRGKPYLRPGWRRGLDGPYWLNTYLTLQDIRQAQESLQLLRDTLVEKFGTPLYFPFELSKKRDLRPTQFYITKIPFELLQLFPSLYEVAQIADDSNPTPIVPYPMITAQELGYDYRNAAEDVAPLQRKLFTVDPAVMERSLKGHAQTQNLVAKHLNRRGLIPRSPMPGEPQYDIAWLSNDEIFVAEIKSLTNQNEEAQLRLGLGQLLRYRSLLKQKGKLVLAFLIVERAPSDLTWIDACEDVGIRLLWPENLHTCI